MKIWLQEHSSLTAGCRSETPRISDTYLLAYICGRTKITKCETGVFLTIGKSTSKGKGGFFFFKKHAKENTFSVFLKCLSLLKDKTLKTKTKARDTFHTFLSVCILLEPNKEMIT